MGKKSANLSQDAYESGNTVLRIDNNDEGDIGLGLYGVIPDVVLTMFFLVVI